MPCRHADGSSRRHSRLAGRDQSRTVAAPAGLRPRRAHEDRDRPRRNCRGVRHSKTIGSPIAIIIDNKDWKNWTEALPVEDFDGSGEKRKNR